MVVSEISMERVCRDGAASEIGKNDPIRSII